VGAAGWRSHRLSCEELIGADETNPSRGPSPPESKKNGTVKSCSMKSSKDPTLGSLLRFLLHWREASAAVASAAAARMHSVQPHACIEH
jgi:hypothetical protein